MSFEFDAPETTKGEGNAIGEPGTYHVCVTDVMEGESSKGKPIDGVTIAMDILSGTTPGQEGKSHTESYFSPDMSQEEKRQEAAKRKLAALFIAGGVLQPAQLGRPAKIEVADMVGRQFVIKLERRMDKDEATGKWDVPTKYVQTAYSDIFHIDDPEVAAVPKNEDALSMIPTELRKPEAWFDFKKKKTSRPAAKQTQPAGSGADDLF